MAILFSGASNPSSSSRRQLATKLWPQASASNKGVATTAGFWTWLQHHENLIRSVLQRCKSCTKTRMHTHTDRQFAFRPQCPVVHCPPRIAILRRGAWPHVLPPRALICPGKNPFFPKNPDAEEEERRERGGPAKTKMGGPVWVTSMVTLQASWGFP